MNMNLRRGGAAVAALALLSTACAGSSPQADEAGELVWAARAGNNEYHQVIADAWNEANPDTPVTIEELPSQADQQRQQLTLELDAEGDAFDVVGLDVIWAGEFAENGWIVPLDDLGEEAAGASLPGPLESGQWQGQQWAMPLYTGAGFLYYRTDLVDQPPETWAELRESGMAIAEESGLHAFAAQGASYEGMVVNYLEYLWSAGGDLFNEDQSEVLFGSDGAALQALEFMRDAEADGLYAPGFNTMTEGESRPLFEGGDAVYLRHWAGPYDAFVAGGEGNEISEVFEIAPLPTFDGEGAISAVGGYNLAVNAYSENQELAKDFIRFATLDHETQSLLADINLPPALESVYADYSDQRIFEVLGEILPHARARPPMPEWNRISTTMQEEIFAGYTGQKDPQAAIDAVRAELEDIISE